MTQQNVCAHRLLSARLRFRVAPEAGEPAACACGPPRIRRRPSHPEMLGVECVSWWTSRGSLTIGSIFDKVSKDLVWHLKAKASVFLLVANFPIPSPLLCVCVCVCVCREVVELKRYFGRVRGKRGVWAQTLLSRKVWTLVTACEGLG